MDRQQTEDPKEGAQLDHHTPIDPINKLDSKRARTKHHLTNPNVSTAKRRDTVKEHVLHASGTMLRASAEAAPPIGRPQLNKHQSRKKMKMFKEQSVQAIRLFSNHPFFSKGCDQTPDPHPRSYIFFNHEHLCHVSDQN